MLRFLLPKNNAQSLRWIIYLLVLSLPLERIPSLAIGGANLRISQVLAVIGIAFWSRQNWNRPLGRVRAVGVFALLFFGLGVGSWLNITDYPRFAITMFGTVLVFLAAYLISRVKIDVWRAMQDLVWVLFGVGLFGYYQFVGDMIGFPQVLTGLREQYTKIVFGIPRVHSTAIEPLYFAGMLMIPLIILIISLLYNRTVTINPTLINWTGKFKSLSRFSIFLTRVNSEATNYFVRWILLGFFSVLFILTLSKGAWLFMSVILAGLFLTRFRLISGFFNKLFKQFKFQIGLGVTGLLIIGIIAWVSVPTIPVVVEGFGGHLIATINGESGTIAERQNFIADGWTLLESNPIIGRGSGHYGVGVKDLGRATSDGSYLITNNVYLEVWLEHGFFSLLVFLSFLIYPLIRLVAVARDPKASDGKSITALMLFWILIGYYLQWTTFSPIFIMPIFILVGLAFNLIQSEEYVK